MIWDLIYFYIPINFFGNPFLITFKDIPPNIIHDWILKCRSQGFFFYTSVDHKGNIAIESY